MAGDTIEQVVVKFIADNTSYLRDIKNMQAEMHKYGVLTSNTLEKIDQKLGKTSKSYKQASTSAQQFHKTGSSGAMSMFQHYTNLGAQLGFLVRQYVSLYAAVRTVTTVMKEGLNFNKFKEETTVAFTVMMRSADAAKAKMEELYDFAVKSPMTFQETAKGARQLMAYGFQAEELVGTMKMLGTVGKAVGVSMDDMAYVYGTLRAQGRAYSRDLLQFGMRGIPIYEELAKVMDVNVSKIQKLASEGQIGFKQVEKAFRNMTNEGGRFGGILDAWMQTFAGKSSMLADIWQKNLGAMTEGTLAIFKDIVDRLIITLDTPEAAETFANMGKSIAGLIELLITLVDIFDKFKVLIIGMTGFKLLTKVTMSLMTMFTGMPGKLVGMAQGLYALKGASALASTSVATLGGGIEVLSSAIAATSFLPIMGGLVVVGAEIFRVIKRVRELKEEFAENMQDPVFRRGQLQASLSSMFISGPESAGGMIYANMKRFEDYVKIAKEQATKYQTTTLEVVRIMNELGIVEGTLSTRLMSWASAMPVPGSIIDVLQDADIPAYMQAIADLSNVDITKITKSITPEGSTVITEWELLGEKAMDAFMWSLSTEVELKKSIAELLGSPLDDEALSKIYETAAGKITEYLEQFTVILRNAGITDPVEISKYTKILYDLYTSFAKKTKDAAEWQKEFNRALDSYNKEISDMADEIDKYVELGFNYTRIQEFDYEFNKLTRDMEANKGIWKYITDPEKRADFIGYMQELNFYRKGQIEETQAFEAANTELSQELEYQLALMEGQAFYANQELAMFDAQLESQKQILQLTIDRGGEGVDAAKQELAWVTKIGEVQRRNLERELALTKAKRFLAGEGSEEYWNSVILRLAGKLGMPMYEKGTVYVPNTGPAILHKGEAVIPAEYMNYLRTGGEKYPFPTRGMQETIDSIINKFIFFGWYKDKNDFINKRQRQIKAGTWKQASALKTEEQFLFSTPEADYYFDPDASTTGTAQAITMGRNIIINPFSTGYQGQDIVNHELGHVRSFNLFGASNMEKLAKKDVYFSLLDKAREANATYLKIYKEYLSRILGGETGLAIDSFFQDKLRPAYDTALQLFRDYQNTDIEVIANWLGGVYGSFPNESNWEDVLGFYANGTGGAKRGPAIVGEKGPELVYMNGGETVIPNHMLNGYADGTEDTLAMRKQMRFKASLAEKQTPVSNAKFLSSLLPEMETAIIAIGNEAVKGMKEAFKEANKIIAMRTTAEVLAFGGEQAMGSEVGKMVSGGDPLTGALTSLASFVMSIENVTKLLNPFSTIIEGMAPIIEPLINGALKPLVGVLITVGEIIGKMLAPILNALSIPLKLLGAALQIVLVPLEIMGQVYEWLNDEVIVPFGNAVIDMMNGLIKLVNKIPGINIAYIEHLQTIEEITTQAERLAVGADALTQTIDYFTEKLREEVDKQLGTYQDLYELGLMTASEYEKNTVNLNKLIPQDTSLVSDADEAITSITDMVTRLATLLGVQDVIETGDLSEQAILGLYDEFGIATTAMSKSEQYLKQIAEYSTGEMDTNLADIVTNTMETANKIGGQGVDTDWPPPNILGDVGEAIGDVIEFVATKLNPLYWVMEGFKSIFGFASGTPFVPSDMMANIHKGEMIVPQTFSDSIRKGELVLSGERGMSGGNIYIDKIVVEGSVLKENDLATSISTAIRRGTKRGFVV